MHPREPADAAAEGVAHDTDVRRRAVKRRQALLDGGNDDVLPHRAGLDAGLSVLGVDLDTTHLAHVDENRSVERRVSPRPVARALNDDP